MAKIIDLFSDTPEILFTRSELDKQILPYIDNLRKEFEEKFNKISEIAEAIDFLLKENIKIRTEIRSLNGNKINENSEKINILLEALKKDFKISVK